MTLALMAYLAASSNAFGIVATVSVVAVEPGVGIIHELEPGETATMIVIVRWDDPSAQFAGMRGDTIASGPMGDITNVGSALRDPGATQPFVRLGEPWAGSLVGTDIAIIPQTFTATPWPWTLSNEEMQFVHFDWTAPAVSSPTEVRFDFRAHPLAPSPRFFPNLGFVVNWVEADTTYVGTTLTILPAPASLGMVVCSLGLMARTRRGSERRPSSIAPSGGRR
ncbi:MAG: hypothetical protein R3B68_06690 [Phycisphaerales bacterium]